MKILVNVNRSRFHEDWTRCEAVKFKETPDGSFDVIIAEDYEKVTAHEREAKKVVTE